MSQTPVQSSKPTAKHTPKKTSVAFGGAEPSGEVQQKALQISKQLQSLYGSPEIPLAHSNHFTLLVAVMLSAQTTDKKVNEVTPELFRLAPDAAEMANLKVEEIQKILKPIGLAPTKARNVLAMSKLLLERHGGNVPASFPELEDLPGVGHKTASVVMSQAFGYAAFPVDTHIHRLAARWGLSSGASVEQTEADLKALFPPATWRDLHLQIILFGREHCPAKQHNPSSCPICSWAAASTPATVSTTTAAAAAATGIVQPSKSRKRKVQDEIAAAAGVTAAVAAAAGSASAAGSTSRRKRK